MTQNLRFRKIEISFFARLKGHDFSLQLISMFYHFNLLFSLYVADSKGGNVKKESVPVLYMKETGEIDTSRSGK